MSCAWSCCVSILGREVRIAVAAVALIGCLASATPPQASESAPAGGIRISFYGFLLDTLRLGMNARVRLWAHSGVGAKLHLGVGGYLANRGSNGPMGNYHPTRVAGHTRHFWVGVDLPNGGRHGRA
jgi:hypothetical protein